MTTQRNTPRDICSSIRPSDTSDPFEGLDQEGVCIPPVNLESPIPHTDNEQSGEKLFILNPLDDTSNSDFPIMPDDAIPSASKQHYRSSPPIESASKVILKHRKKATVTKPITKKQRPKLQKHLFPDDTAVPPVNLAKNPVHPIIEKAYHYAELTQIRQKIFSSLEAVSGKTLLIASPLDNIGSSLLAAALAYNTACSCQQNVLLIDCNMRRAGLHDYFSVPQSYGFTNLIQHNLSWQAVVKETSIAG